MSKSASCSSAKASGVTGARCIDAVALNVSPCSEAFTACLIRGRLPLHLHSPALPQDNNRDWGCSSQAYHCRHFPIARCTFLPFNKISTTAASLFFLCKDSPARALQVPVGTPYLCTKFQHAFRIFFFTPCRTVAKQNVVFQNFPGYSLHFALSTVGSYMHVKITKAQCFNL